MDTIEWKIKKAENRYQSDFRPKVEPARKVSNFLVEDPNLIEAPSSLP